MALPNSVLNQGLKQIGASSSTPTLAELTTNVELFNGLTLDSSKQMFQACLGTEFPFDVIDSVQKYANKLTKFLNSSLDDLLCGTAITDVYEDTKNFGSEMADSVSKAAGYDKYGTNPLFSSEAEAKSYQENGLKTSHTISGNDWVNTWNKDSLGKELTLTLTSGDIGADSVTLSCMTAAVSSTGSASNYTANGNMVFKVSIVNLRCGPNDGSGPNTDGKNVLPSISGDFIYTASAIASGTPTTLSLPSQTCPFSGSPNISCTISADFIGVGPTTNLNTADPQKIPNFVVKISNLQYNNAWSNVSSGLNSNQKANIDNIQNTTLTNVKDTAFNVLKTEFMTSSIAQDSIKGTINDLKASYPALSQVNTDQLTDKITSSFANSAIALVTGNPSKIDTSFVSAIATEITTSSINSGLEQLGMPAGVNISQNCTKELLSKAGGIIMGVGIGAIGALGLAASAAGTGSVVSGAASSATSAAGSAIGTVASATGSAISTVSDGVDSVMTSISKGLSTVTDYISFDVSSAVGSSILGDVSEKFAKLVNSDCVKAINNNFNIVSDQMANVAGAVGDLATGKITAASTAAKVASQYVKL